MKGKFECSTWGGWQEASSYHSVIRYTYRGKELSFSSGDLGGQCGAMVIYDFDTEGLRYIDNPYFSILVADLKEFYKKRAGVLVASAIKKYNDNSTVTELHSLLEESGWLGGDDIRNPNTNNIITIFELNLGK